MFDLLSAQFLQQAPALEGIDPEDLPRILTRSYTQLVSLRLRGEESEHAIPTIDKKLGRIADVYEIISSSNVRQDLKRASAFVSASAHLILARRQRAQLGSGSKPLFDRYKVDPAITSGLLFLMAEQYADANEAGYLLPEDIPEDHFVSYSKILTNHLRNLIQGKVHEILDPKNQTLVEFDYSLEIEKRALQAITYTLCKGIELLASEILDTTLDEYVENQFATSDDAFHRVIQLTSAHSDGLTSFGFPVETGYSGPLHLASILSELAPSLRAASLARLELNRDAEGSFFKEWLRFRATTVPYIWRNHQEALKTNFHQAGCSAVLVLPTGAGKTTVSTLKIANTLSRQKKVIFLAPTHALVEQVKENLKEIFPRERFGLDVSNDFDSFLIDDRQLQDIEVMTPEACLTMLSYTPDSFNQVGLLVFDECHLLSPESGRIGRSLDGMLCVLTFSALAGDADLLFLSAMLKNSVEFAEWIEELTQRTCLPIDLLWKPSRQARGVVVYERNETQSVLKAATNQQNKLDQKKSKSRSLRAAARKLIKIHPFALWGLENNWLDTGKSIAITSLIEEPLQLNGAIKRGRLHLTPNANHVAEELAGRAGRNGLKTIIFVNRKDASVSTARSLAKELGADQLLLSQEESNLWREIGTEFGDVDHSHIDGSAFKAVPHNSSMLRVERLLAEKLFSRKDGANVIVATPTLAQGLNLPAHLAILAGDQRTSEGQEKRERLATHEILNAAARAGRAGHLANGAVLLIPEPVMVFERGSKLSDDLREKLSNLLPEDDRCVTITDPLERILDQIANGELSGEAEYTINRLASLGAAGRLSTEDDYILPRSFGAYIARKRNEEDSYAEKVRSLALAVTEIVQESPSNTVLRIASFTGLPLKVLNNLIDRLRETTANPPSSISEWLNWLTTWLSDDSMARNTLLGNVRTRIMSATGNKADAELTPAVLDSLSLGLQAWIEGKPINVIEVALGGDPSQKNNSRFCPRTRSMVTSVIPRSISFLLGVVAKSVQEMELHATLNDPEPSLIDNMAIAVRKGVDSVEKLEYWSVHGEILSRVRLHQEFEYDQ